MDRQTWLAERKKCLGATDIASILGHGFGTPQTVWKDKTTAEVVDTPPHPLLRMGLALERTNIELFCERLDLKYGENVIKPTGITMHPVHSWLGATLDFQRDTGSPVETKYVAMFRGDRWGDELTDHVPNGYLIQCLTQMECVGADMADLSALGGFGEHRIYRIGRNAKIVGLILEVGHEFWERFVVAGVEPPEGWMHPAAGEIAEQLIAIEKEKSVVLGDDVAAIASTYVKLGQIIKEAEEERESAKDKLIQAMAEASKAVAGEYRLSKWFVPEKSVEPKPYTTKARVDFRASPIKTKDTKKGIFE